jgi:hypothetical protein
MTLFIVRDATGNLLTKDLSWTMDCVTTELFKTPHKDVALNQLLELNASDVGLRAQIVACEVDNKNRPVIRDNPSVT